MLTTLLWTPILRTVAIGQKSRRKALQVDPSEVG
jgi:hypothetical protein